MRNRQLLNSKNLNLYKKLFTVKNLKKVDVSCRVISTCPLKFSFEYVCDFVILNNVFDWIKTIYYTVGVTDEAFLGFMIKHY